MAAPPLALQSTRTSPAALHPLHNHLPICDYPHQFACIVRGFNQRTSFTHLIGISANLRRHPFTSIKRSFAASSRRSPAYPAYRAYPGYSTASFSAGAPGLPSSAGFPSASPSTSGSPRSFSSSSPSTSRVSEFAPFPSAAASASASSSPAASGLPRERASPGSSASPGGDAASVELQRASAGGATSADCAASPGGDASGGGEPHLFCFGLGYVAVALANVLLTKGWRVSGTCRSQEDWHRLCHMGVQAHLLEDQGAESTLCLSQASLSALHSATHVLVSIPPLLSPRPSSPQHVDVVLSSCCQHLMQSARHRLRWIGYLSSTGVYGDWDGQWVDEDSPPRPLTPKAIARYAAEREWLAFQAQLGEALSDALVQTEALSDGIQRSEEGRSHLERSQGEGSALAVRVFRLGGIYGPFRSALDTAAAEMQAGEGPSLKSAPALNPPRNGRAESIYEGSSVSALKLTSDGDSDSSGSSSSNPDSSSNGLKSSSNRDRRQRKRFTSRCHVADICAAIGASMDGRGSSPIINVVDDDPSPRRHVMQFARQLIASGESDLYWQKLEALRVTLPPGIIRRGSSGRVRGAEQEKKRTTHPTVATGTDLMVTGETGREEFDPSTGVESSGLVVNAMHEHANISGGMIDGGEVRCGVSKNVLKHKLDDDRETVTEPEPRTQDGSASLPDGEKRVRNHRMKSELSGVLQFSSFADALKTMASGHMDPFN